MTRFARAKGSKASNEKAPEDGTPWEVMKEQLLRTKQDTEETKKREEAEKQRIENYENFLKEQKIAKRKATWCDFPENTTKDSSQNDTTSEKKKKKNKETPKLFDNTESTQIGNENSKSANKGITKNKNKFQSDAINHVESHSENNTNDTGVTESTKKKKKKNKQKFNSNNHSVSISEVNSKEAVAESPVSTSKNSNVTSASDNQTKNKKNRDKKKKKNMKTDPETEISDIPNNNVTEDVSNKPVEKTNNSNSANQNKKKKKIQKNGEPTRRKAIDDRSFQLIINGKEVELIRFEGFPIMKKDAERLEELKTSMIKKGIPKSEVQRTIKLERRRAEKALARLKREVCYNCRKGGHNLSDCPELKTKIPGVDGANDGLCFKCGSTEHRQFECKVQRDKEFRFATCFICKDQGHIARQCPDNPKGLYPNGGCCKLCGDVTHLKKDCPTTKDQKEDTSVKLHMLNDGNIEDIGQRQNTAVPEETSRKPKKIKF